VKRENQILSDPNSIRHWTRQNDSKTVVSEPYFERFYDCGSTESRLETEPDVFGTFPFLGTFSIGRNIVEVLSI
jgi:hypothetical protein